jgi:hypothetical protein
LRKTASGGDRVHRLQDGPVSLELIKGTAANVVVHAGGCVDIVVNSLNFIGLGIWVVSEVPLDPNSIKPVGDPTLLLVGV